MTKKRKKGEQNRKTAAHAMRGRRREKRRVVSQRNKKGKGKSNR